MQNEYCVNELLDDLAAVAERWSANRKLERTSPAIRAALLMAAEEVLKAHPTSTQEVSEPYESKADLNYIGEKIHLIIKHEMALASHNANELALGFIRYEALRRLNPRQYAELERLNRTGNNFDGMVDRLIADEKFYNDLNV